MRVRSWRPRTPRVQWWLTFLVLFGLGSCWALLTPLFGGPDENEHVVRAWGIAEGELNGARTEEGSELRSFLVPEALERFRGFPCWGPQFAQRAKLPTCAPSFTDSEERVRVSSRAAEYPPAYYVVAAAPALADIERPLTLYAMRLVNALMFAALVASAFVSVLGTRVPKIASAGLLLALTPLAVSLGGVVNPNGPEIAAAILLWTAGVAAVSRAPIEVDRRLVTRVGVAATVLTLSRPLSPLWLGLILVAIALLGTREGLMRLWRSGPVRVWAVIAGAATVFQLAWVAHYGVYLIPALAIDDVSVTDALRSSIGRQEVLFRDAIGNLHGGGALAPGSTITLWIAALGALAIIAMLWSPRRCALVVLGIALACVVVPVVLEVRDYRDQGLLFWRARYTLPLSVGIPIVSGMLLARAPRLPARQLGRLASVLAGTFVLASWLAFANDGHRLTVGIGGPLMPWSEVWSPPVPLTVLDLAYLLLLGLLVLLVARPATVVPHEPEPTDVTGDEPPPTEVAAPAIG